MAGINSFFDEQRVVERTPIIELKSIYGVDPLRDIVVGSVTNDGTEYEVTAQANGDVSRLSSAERGPYPPGQEVEPGLAVRLLSVPTGGQKVRLGYFDDEDGFFVEYNAIGMYLMIRRGSTDSIVEEWGKWEGDSVVNKNSRAGSFKPSDGFVYHFPFVWYGFGPIQFSFQLRDRLGGNWFQSLATTRSVGQTSLVQPHLPLRVETSTEAGDAAYAARVSGRQLSIIGKYSSIFRETTVEASLSNVDDAAWYPIASVRRKSLKPYALTQIEELEMISNTSVRVALIEGATIANTANWTGSVTDYGNLSLLEENTNPGGAGLSGNLIKKMLLNGSGKGNNATGDGTTIARAFLVEDRNFTIAVRKVAGATSGTVNIAATFREDF